MHTLKEVVSDIPAVDEFHYTPEAYEDFIKFAMTQEFDYRSRREDPLAL